MTKQVGVVLAGCGYLDGTEIQEAVLSLYFLERGGAAVRAFAPDRPQMHVVEHLSQIEASESRNVLQESARLVRGAINPLSHADMVRLEALVIPGGYGVAKNLSSFATQGAAGTVDGELVRLIGQAIEARKPIVALCIAPAIVALALRQLGHRARLTIGHEEESAAAISALGCTHIKCDVDDIVVDEPLRIISTPAYMLGPGPAQIGAGIEKAIAKMFSWI
jgi:enhancing lycopene biosynthesis protein 2